MKILFVLCLLAGLFWFIIFSPWTYGKLNFWAEMVLATGVLAGAALFSGKKNLPSVYRFKYNYLVIGVLSAAVLYLVFLTGDAISTQIFSFGAEAEALPAGSGHGRRGTHRPDRLAHHRGQSHRPAHPAAGRAQTGPAQPAQNPLDSQPAIEKEAPPQTSHPISVGDLLALREISRLGTGRPEELAVSPDNRSLAAAASTGVYIYQGDQLSTWLDPGGWATSVQFSPDGDILAVGLRSGDIQLWDWQAGIRTTLQGHTARVKRLLYSQTGLMYSAAADGNIIVWEPSGNEMRKTVIDAHSRPVNDIAVTGDSRIIVSCSDDGLIRVWDVAGQPFFMGTSRLIFQRAKLPVREKLSII